MRARVYISWNRGRAISIDSRSAYCFRCINLRNDDCDWKKKKERKIVGNCIHVERERGKFNKGKERNKLEKKIDDRGMKKIEDCRWKKEK